MSKSASSLAPATTETSAYRIYLRLLAYTKPYILWFVIACAGFAIYALANVAYAQVMKYLVLALEDLESTLKFWVPVMIIGATLLRGIGMFIGNYFMSKVGFNVVDTLRVEAFNHMTKLPAHTIDGRQSGHLVSLINYNINGVTLAATDALKKGVREGATVIGLLAYLLYLDWKLTLLFLTVAPLMGMLVSKVARRLRRLNTKVQDSVGDITQITGEMIGGYRVMRSFGAESYERARFADASRKNYKQNMKIVLTTALNSPIMHLLVAISMAFLIFIALNFMTINSPADFIAYITALGMIVNPIRSLGEVGPMILRGVAAADSIFKLLDEPVERDTGTQTLARAKGDIEFKHVGFHYSGTDQSALQDINLRVNQGEVVALVGKSGSGKSTLVNLLPRFYELSAGEILLDGVPISQLTLDNLRAQIAFVNQQVVLFEGSVADNIAYGIRDQVTDAQIKRAADLAFVSDFVQHLPEGLATQIGESGARLSGGQRQRIAIARAILKDAPIIILDEATSALDNESEHFVQAALEQVMKGRTTFVIAHRLSTIENADKIIVMGDGKIVEVGSHAHLLNQGGAYQRLHGRDYQQPDAPSGDGA